MADQPILKATLRSEFGKGAARRFRRDGLLPGVLYGHGQEVQHLVLDTHEVFLAVKGQSNALVTVEVEGKKHLALVKDVQVEPVRRVLEHIDLVVVNKSEKVTVDVPVILEGEVAGQATPTLELLTLNLSVPAAEIPEHISVDVSGLSDGDVLHVADLKLPQNVEVNDDPEATVVVVEIVKAEVAETTEAETKAE